MEIRNVFEEKHISYNGQNGVVKRVLERLRKRVGTINEDV
jgi:hypothetical protein